MPPGPIPDAPSRGVARSALRRPMRSAMSCRKNPESRPGPGPLQGGRRGPRFWRTCRRVIRSKPWASRHALSVSSPSASPEGFDLWPAASGSHPSPFSFDSKRSGWNRDGCSTASDGPRARARDWFEAQGWSAHATEDRARAGKERDSASRGSTLRVGGLESAYACGPTPCSRR